MESSIPSLARSALVALALCALPAAAHAEDEAAARTLFRGAKAAYDVGEFQHALTGFAAAYQAKPLPAILFNIAQCHRQLGHWTEAAYAYNRFLELQPDSPDASTARELLAEVQAHQKALQAEAAPKPVDVEPAKAPSPARATTLQAQGALAATRTAGEVSAAPDERPIYKSPWLWAGAGAAVVAATVVAIIVAHPHAPDGSLGTVDAR